eukprot:scaffold1723_cov144-Skeletonema_menzelii.AAC.3
MFNSCLSFPEVFSTNVGLGWNDTIPDSATFTQSFKAGNITASQAVEVVDQYVNAVYKSSAEGASSNPYGCDVGGLATLQNCTSSTGTPRSLRKDKEIVKAVTLSGAFIPSFASGGETLTMDEVNEFYTDKDFEEMVKLGVNTIQVPVPCDAFYTSTGDMAVTITNLLNEAAKAGLSAIIVLVKPDETSDKTASEVVDNHIKAAASYAKSAPSVIALQLPSPTPSLLSSVRSVATKLSVLVPVNKGELGMLSFPPDKHLFAALDTGATTSVADVASSNSLGDRMKMFYHESVTCIDRSPIEWLSCYQDMPVYVTSGFDLAIDDCINRDNEGFKDYGQCGRFDETTDSGWWKRHRQSLAGRQLFTYSKGLGWSFSAWKLYGDHGSGDMTPAKLMCLRDVAAAGLLPPMEDTNELGSFCLNGPANDFTMGDETYAPTPAPVDCGNGWWNETIGDCSYWIPPPPTAAPTKETCPSCKGAGAKEMSVAAAAGAVAALVLNLVMKKCMRGNNGYEVLP